MNVSRNWLLSIAPTITGSPEVIAERLGMLGAPVDELSRRGEGLKDIIVARVQDVRPHPNADRLRLCVVDAGGEPLQVVCGAPNVVAGGTYPFAPIGAVLPGGMEIRKAKIRGESSEGMLCSPSELGLGRDHSGIMTLVGEWRPGASLAESIQLEDAVFTLDITPNRGDLLSHIGVARELAPGGVKDIRLAPFTAGSWPLEYRAGGLDVESPTVRIRIESAEDCPRYVGAVIEGVAVGPSPEWLATRLRAIGSRPINNVVDATNYVLQELGQPLHAFDLDTLEGAEIRVRRAADGEKLQTLDGVERSLDSSMLVIADRSRPVALAGVMGGLETEVTEKTGRILIECALFDPQRVRAGARALGLSTEASHRYERGVDPEGQRRAIERVVDLVLAVAGGAVATPVLDAHPGPHRPPIVLVRPERVRQVLGMALSQDEIVELLRPIGIVAEPREVGLEVIAPSFRPDLTREIDVIEEIARRRGYDSFESELRGFRPGSVPIDPLEATRRAVQEVFARWGFLEARTAAFSPAGEGRVPLLNPLSAEESHLRDDLVSGLFRRVEHNWSHGVRSIRIFEMGSVFAPAAGPRPEEEVRLGAVFSGPRRPPHWSEPARPFDVWDLEGLLGDLASALGFEVAPGTGGTRPFPHLDPAETFTLAFAGSELRGAGGRVRSDHMDAPAWADPVYALELPLVPLSRAGMKTYRDLPSFPQVDRDIALVVPNAITARAIENTIRGAAGALLESVTPFDVYEGEALGAGRRSIAWRLRFRHAERTLTDSEVEESLARVLTALREEHGVERR